MRQCVIFCLGLVGGVVATTASVAQAPAVADAMPFEKQRELAAAGIVDWEAGQNRLAGPKFSSLTEPIRSPEKDTCLLQYDDGTIDALPTVFGQIYGNRFSQNFFGSSLDTITLNSFSFYFAEDSTPDTGLFFQAAAPGSTSAVIDARVSTNVAGLFNAGQSFSMLTSANQIPQTALGTTGMFFDTFYLGAWSLNNQTTVPVDNETLGLSTGGVRLQGYTASSGTGSAIVQTPQPYNAILRANITSPTFCPVELMAFSVD